MLNMPNQHVQDANPNTEPDLDLERCRLFIYKIKEHRHDKTKRRQIDKFNHLYFKCYGYHHNLSRQAQNLDSIDTQSTLSRHQNVPSSLSRTSTQTSSNPVLPATFMAHTPSTSTDPATSAAPRLPTKYMDTCTNNDCTNKWVINLSKTPLTTEQLSLLQKGHNFAIPPKYPP